jgi:hypothetical protein
MNKLKIILLLFIPILCKSQNVDSQLIGNWTLIEYGTDITGYEDSLSLCKDTSVFHLELNFQEELLEFNRTTSRFKIKDSLTFKWSVKRTEKMQKDSTISIEGAQLVFFSKKIKNPSYSYSISKINSSELVLMERTLNQTYGYYSFSYYKFKKNLNNNSHTESMLYGIWSAPNKHIDNIDSYDTITFVKTFKCPDVCEILKFNFIHNNYKPDIFFLSQESKSKYDGVFVIGSEANWVYAPLENTIIIEFSRGQIKRYKIIEIDTTQIKLTTANTMYRK